MSLYKLQKIKKYLNENLLKNFITFNKILYFSLILFTLKINDDFAFVLTIENSMSLLKKITTLYYS